MSLPSGYEDTKKYFEDVLSFLGQFQWIFNYRNTHLLVNKVFENFPEEWGPYLKDLSIEDLNNLSLGKYQQTAPESLKLLLNQVKVLSPDFSINFHKLNYTFPHNAALSAKKKNEILSLAPLIHSICQKNKIRHIIDVGTGLGYLPRLLYENYGYSILGIDCNKNYIQTAKNIQQGTQLQFIEHFINENSVDFLNSYAKDNSIESVCITGLHACADLGAIILDIFHHLDFAKSLVIMPCCYHRLSIKCVNNNEEEFYNFPISEELNVLKEKYCVTKILKTSFLRLACQNSSSHFREMTEEEHENHSKICLFRAILQEVAESGNQQVQRIKRKSNLKFNNPSEKVNFEEYLIHLKQTHKLIRKDGGGDNNIDDECFLYRMREKWDQHKDDCFLVEVLTAFQAAIQSICENIVLLDRLKFLMEKGVNCWIEKVTEDSVSPRCYAIVAVK